VHADFLMAAAASQGWQIPVLTPVWNALVLAIWSALAFIYSYVGDAGLSIIVLTIVMRIAMIPLTWRQTKSMYEMQQLQPKIKELQAKYKKDPEKLQQETMKFYQDNKVNPLGGCLPLIIQMPVFIALYQVLSKVGNLTQLTKAGLPITSALAHLGTGSPYPVASFYFILQNLAMSPQQVFQEAMKGGFSVGAIGPVIPYAILVALFSLSIYLPQRMISTDAQQQRIGLIMAVMFLWFGWIAPAGVLLYWVTSSAWQVGQQWLTIRVMKQRAEEAQTA
jgi:YidC/Oxa1 family membrane protein insertase